MASGVGLVIVRRCDGLDTGSGFLVDGTTMVTAAHVVDGAAGVQVAFNGHRQNATVLGIDPGLDIAMLTVPRQVGHVFTLASGEPGPGTSIAAIGYPLDEPESLTEGSISGLDRTISTDSGTFTGLLQTDTAINPGNSGGPLVNLDGQVVGLADAIRTGAQGIGFAVPAVQLRPAIETHQGLIRPPEPTCIVTQTPPTSGVQETPPTAGGQQTPPTAAVQQTLQSYLDAINADDYAAAMSLVGPEIRSASTESQWTRDYATTRDDSLQIYSITGSGATVHVWATFRSYQAPGYGPVGAKDATCLVWSIDYVMTQAPSGWVISQAAGHTTPPWSQCG